MANGKKTSGPVAASPSGHFVSKNPGKSGRPAKAVAGSALSQSPAKATPGAVRVIREVSFEHREALKRLVDR
jgi:hypothetical protein